VRAVTAPAPVLEIVDDDGERLLFDPDEAAHLFALTGGLDSATVSACPQCRSRIVAVVALVDLLEASPPFSRGEELVELADEAPTLHLYVRDLSGGCAHRGWRDPGYEEWVDALTSPVERPR
jgi:hypothetical protein